MENKIDPNRLNHLLSPTKFISKDEYHLGKSKINKKLHLSDLLNIDYYLNDEKTTSKFYDLININDSKLLREDSGRCKICHACIDKVCCIKLVCRANNYQCYRRKYKI